MGKIELTESELARWIVEYIEGADVADMQDYGGNLLNAARTQSRRFQRFYWFTGYLLKLGRMFDARVLDVGCGFGWDAVAFSLLGRNGIVANDIRDSMTGPLAERMDALKDKGAPVKVETLTADICKVDIPAASFDAVYCNEAIEHIHDLDAMFAKCATVLKPGGRCVLVNDNNVLCRQLREEHAQMWKKRDESWDYIEELKKRRPIENRDIEPYGVMRAHIITAANPNLGEEDVRRITAATAGLAEAEIAALAETFGPDTVLPTPPKTSWCRNPVTGEYCERLLDPYEICDHLERHGFRARACHAFRRFPLTWLNQIPCRPLNRMLYDRRPIFVVVAQKA